MVASNVFHGRGLFQSRRDGRTTISTACFGLAALLWTVPGAAQVTRVEFQQGAPLTGDPAVYFGATDSSMRHNSAAFNTIGQYIDGVNNGNNDEQQYFVQFDQIFGIAAGQIPLGATILDAQLTLTTGTATNNQSNGRFVVAGMTVPFTSATTLGDLGTTSAALATNGPTYANGNATLPVGGYVGPQQGSVVSAFVAPVVQRWSTGVLANNGLVVQAHTTDAWWNYGIADATIGFRPKLSVSYITEPTDTASIVPGVNGYGGMTMVSMDGVSGATIDQTDAGSLFVDGATGGTPPGDSGSPDVLALVKFDGIFGSGASQVPARAEIAKGWLVLTTSAGSNSQSRGPFSVYRMNDAWDASSTYASYGAAGPVAGVDYAAAPSATVRPMEKNQQAWFDVTNDIEAWFDGSAANNGLLVRTLATTDGWEFGSGGNTDVNRRPDLRVTYTADPLVWQGNLSATWDAGSAIGTGGTQNWALSSDASATNFVETDRVVFNDSAAGSGAVTVAVPAAVAPQLATIDNSARSYVFTGAGGITGAGRLVKNGAGIATLETTNTFTGGTTVTAGTLQIGTGGALGTITGPVAIEAGATLRLDRSGALAIDGELSGAGALVKQGSGTATISGDHTFAGSIDVTAGSLGLSPFAHAGGITVSDGATLLTLCPFTPAPLSTSTLTLGNAGSTLAFDLASSTNPTVPLLTVTQADGFALGSGSHQITVTTSGAIQPGRFTLVDYAGNSISSGFTLASLPPRVNASLEYDQINTSIDLAVLGTDRPRWVGSASAVWDAGSAVDVGGSFNWDVGGSATNFANGDQVIFDDSSAVTGVSLAGAVSPGAISVDNSAVNYTFSGPGSFTGAGVLTKSGTGSLSLLADQASTGGITVFGGSVIIGDATVAPTVAGPVAVASGANFSLRQGSLAGGLMLNGGSVELVAGSLSGGAAINAGTLTVGTGGSGLALAGDVFIDAISTLAFDLADELTYNQSLSGTGTITKAGPGMVTFGGSSPFTGTVVINGGSLVLADNGGGGDLNAADVIVNAGGTFQFGVNLAGNPDVPDTTYITANTGGQVIWEEPEQLGGVNLAGGSLDLKLGGFTAGGANPSRWNAGTLTGTGPAAQVLGGASGIDKTGPGTVTVSGNASISVTGGLAIAEGMILHDAVANLGTSDVLLGGDFTTGTFGYAGATASRGGSFSLNAGGGGFEVTGPTATLTLTGPVTGAGSLTKTGPGTLAILADNQATGSFVVAGGTLAVAATALPAGVSVADAATFAVVNGQFPGTLVTPTLQLGSTGSTLGFVLTGAGFPGSPLLQVTVPDGLTTSGGSHTLAIESAQELTQGRFTLVDYTGSPISSGFAFVAPPRVAAAIVYDTANTTIDLDITGISQVRWTGSTSAIWDVGAAVDVGGTRNWADTVSAQSTNFVAGDRPRFDDTASAGTVALVGSLEPASVVVDTFSLDYSFVGSGSLGGGGSLTKSGGARLTLAVADTRSGATTVTGGTLQLGTADVAASLAGPLSVDFGSSLEVVNAAVGGPVTVTGGTMTVTGGSLAGTLDLVSGSTLSVDRADDMTYGGRLSGDGSITKLGAGTLTLLGASTGFTGPVVIDAGTLVLDDLGAGGDLNTTSITVNTGGRFVFGANGNPDLPGDTFITMNAGSRTEIRQGENFGGVILDGGDLVFAGDFRSNVNFTAERDAGIDLRSGSITTEFTNVATGGVLNRTGSTIAVEKTTTGTVVLGPGVSIGGAIPVNLHEGTLALSVAALQAAHTGEYLIGDIGPATLRLDGPGQGTRAAYTLIGSSGGTFDVSDAGGTLTFTGEFEAQGGFTKAGPGTLVLTRANALQGTIVTGGVLRVADPAALGSGPVSVTGGTLQVATGVVLQGQGVTVDGGSLSAGSLTVGGSGLTTVAVTRGGITGSPVIDVTAGGSLTLPAATRTVVTATSLTVDDTGSVLDLGSSAIQFAAGGIDAAALRADILAGRGNGSWNGTAGITSATAAATSGRAVGYVINGDGSGQVGYAAVGDVDLSGAVNVFDLVSINSAGKYGSGSASVWSQGDFNYDGVTNVFDLVGINTAGAYGRGNYFPAASVNASGIGAVSAVPEPASLGLGILSMAAILGLFRRRSHRTAL